VRDLEHGASGTAATAGAGGEATGDEDGDQDGDEQDAEAPPTNAPTGLRSPTHPEGEWTASREIQLAWAPPSGDIEVDRYSLVLDPAGDDPSLDPTPVTGDLSASITAPADGTYTVHVVAVRPDGTSGPAADHGPVRIDTQPPQPPDAVQATVLDDGRVEVTWDPAQDATSGIEGHLVERSPAGDDGDATPLTAGPVTDTTLVDEPPGEAAAYTYAVAAVDRAGLESDARDAAPGARLDPHDEGTETLVASPATAQQVAEHLNRSSPVALAALDTTGDGAPDALDENVTGAQLVRTAEVDGEAALLLRAPDARASSLWLPASDEAHPVSAVEVDEAAAELVENGTTATVSVDAADGWTLVDAPDLAPADDVERVEHADGTPVPTDRVWREDGRVLVLEQGPGTLDVLYSQADENPTPFPAAAALVALLAATAGIRAATPRRRD
jgi:hypothetical protein